MREIIRLLVQIALLKRGPQDLPVSRALLLQTVCAYVALTALVSELLPQGGAALLPLAVEVAFTLAWYAVLLDVLGRRERFLQTATAVFGLQALFTQPVLVALWLLRRYGQDEAWQLPLALAGFAGMAVVVWMVAANIHVVKAALEFSTAASVGLVLLHVACGQLLLFTLFTPPPV